MRPGVRMSGLTGPLTGKGRWKLEHHYQKSYGALHLGQRTKKGHFFVDLSLAPQYNRPIGLDSCLLQPYVSRRTPVQGKASAWFPRSLMRSVAVGPRRRLSDFWL